MPPPDIVFLHTSPVHVVTFAALLEQAGAGVQAAHIVDETLLGRARMSGASAPEVVRDVQAAVLRAARSTGARIVVCTCSTVGGAAERTATGGAFLAMRIDRSMAERAVALGPHVLIVAALESTLQPTSDLVQDCARTLDCPLQIETLLVADAWRLFEAGDTAAYLVAVVQAVRGALPGPGVVVLAQASMAPAVALLGDVGVEVLASPPLGVQAALDRLQAMAAEMPSVQPLQTRLATGFPSWPAGVAGLD